MIDLLKSMFPTAKDLVSFRLPKAIQEGMALGVFLGALILVSGFTYVAFAADSLHDPLRSELMWPRARLRTYLECGIDGLAGGSASSASLPEVSIYFGLTIMWYLIMVILGAASLISSFLHDLLRDRIDAKALELSDTDIGRLERQWTAYKARHDAESHIKWLKDWLLTAQLGIYVTRTLLLLCLLAFSVSLLFTNPTSALVLGAYFDNQVITELGRWYSEVGYRSFGMISAFCLVWAWFTFRYSHAGAKFRALILLSATANLLLLAGNVGALRGESRIRFQEVQILGSRFDEEPLLQEAALFMLSRTRSSLRLYSCETQNVIEVRLSGADIVVGGSLVSIGSLCQGTIASK